MKSFGSPLCMRWPLALLAACLLPSCGGDGDSGNNTAGTPGGIVATDRTTVTDSPAVILGTTFTATLTGAQQTPPVQSAATASGIIMVDPATRVAKVTVTTFDIIGTGVHVHAAAAGATGPIVFPLAEISASGIWTAQVTLTDAQLNALRAGNYYLNVRSAAFPNGEIRGQIM